MRTVCRIHGELGGRRIAPVCRIFQARQRQRIDAFAQYRFQRVFPALLDADGLPQARRAIQLMLREPCLQVLVVIELRLQLLQGVQPRFGLRQLALQFLHGIALLAALGIGQRQTFLQFRQLLLLHLEFVLHFDQLLLVLLQQFNVGLRQIIAFQHQARTAAVQLLHIALHMPALGLEYLQLLLDEHLLALHRIEALLRHACGLFDLRQALRLGSRCGSRTRPRARRHLPAVAASACAGCANLAVASAAARSGVRRSGSVATGGCVVRRGRRSAVPAATLRHCSHTARPAWHAARRTGRNARYAQLSSLALDFTQLGDLGFQVVLGLLDLLRKTRSARLGFLLVHQPQQFLRGIAPRFQFAVGLGHLGLLAQMHQLLVQFLQDVADAQQVVARIAQAQFGLAAAVAVFGHACRFFEEYAQFLRLGLDDPRDHALFDDGIGARAHPGAEEDVGDVLAAHRLVVDVVAGIAVALQHALDGDFGVGRPLPADLAQRVVEHQLDAGARHRLARAGAVEDHVLHGFAAQSRGARLAQHPAQSVDDVGLAAAVGADDAHKLPGQRDMGGIDEGLETG